MTTALTFGCASAALVSMLTIRACATGRAQDRQVQHARQLHVVDVPALAADEPGVLLAEHPAVADRLLVVVVERAVGASWRS